MVGTCTDSSLFHASHNRAAAIEPKGIVFPDRSVPEALFDYMFTCPKNSYDGHSEPRASLSRFFSLFGISLNG
jgi:hypothetical protein